MDKAGSDLLKEMFGNEDYYLQLAESKSSEYRKELQSLYKEAKAAFNVYVRDFMSETMSLAGEVNARKEHKIDPFIAGGAAQGAAGLGAGVYAALSASERNAEIDNRRAYYSQRKSQDELKRRKSESTIDALSEKLDYKLNSYDKIKEIRVFEQKYIKAMDLMNGPYANKLQAKQIFQSLGDYKESKKYVEEVEYIERNTKTVSCSMAFACAVILLSLYALLLCTVDYNNRHETSKSESHFDEVCSWAGCNNKARWEVENDVYGDDINRVTENENYELKITESNKNSNYDHCDIFGYYCEDHVDKGVKLIDKTVAGALLYKRGSFKFWLFVLIISLGYITISIIWSKISKPKNKNE